MHALHLYHVLILLVAMLLVKVNERRGRYIQEYYYISKPMTQGNSFEGICNALATPIPAPAATFSIASLVTSLVDPLDGPSATLCFPARKRKLNFHCSFMSCDNVWWYEWHLACIDSAACTSGEWSVTKVMWVVVAGISTFFNISRMARGSATVDDS